MYIYIQNGAGWGLVCKLLAPKKSRMWVRNSMFIHVYVFIHGAGWDLERILLAPKKRRMWVEIVYCVYMYVYMFINVYIDIQNDAGWGLVCYWRQAKPWVGVRFYVCVCMCIFLCLEYRSFSYTHMGRTQFLYVYVCLFMHDGFCIYVSIHICKYAAIEDAVTRCARKKKQCIHIFDLIYVCV